LDYPPT
jgi:dynein heavy chain, axonemal